LFHSEVQADHTGTIKLHKYASARSRRPLGAEGVTKASAEPAH